MTTCKELARPAVAIHTEQQHLASMSSPSDAAPITYVQFANAEIAAQHAGGLFAVQVEPGKYALYQSAIPKDAAYDDVASSVVTNTKPQCEAPAAASHSASARATATLQCSTVATDSHLATATADAQPTCGHHVVTATSVMVAPQAQHQRPSKAQTSVAASRTIVAPRFLVPHESVKLSTRLPIHASAVSPPPPPASSCQATSSISAPATTAPPVQQPTQWMCSAPYTQPISAAAAFNAPQFLPAVGPSSEANANAFAFSAASMQATPANLHVYKQPPVAAASMSYVAIAPPPPTTMAAAAAAANDLRMRAQIQQM